jgi:SAM-dependent methyltransferase
MESLAEKAFWDARYDPKQVPKVPVPGDPRRTLRAFTRNYDEYVIWNQHFEAWMPRGEGRKVLEIGSAPGYYLVQLHQRFGLDPWGIEYSEPGVAMNRAYFRANGLDPDHIVQGDFFDDEWLSRNAGQYDVVVSRGFIEHFVDVETVVSRHVHLLKPGGRLFLTVPNFRGIYGHWLRRFNRVVYEKHNVEIMDLAVFERLFARPDLQTCYCGYYGTFHLGRFKAGDAHPVLQRLTAQRNRMQFLFNAAFRLMFGLRDPNHPWWSPFLLYIGEAR